MLSPVHSLLKIQARNLLTSCYQARTIDEPITLQSLFYRPKKILQSLLFSNEPDVQFYFPESKVKINVGLSRER